jgi:hypothetical protein
VLVLALTFGVERERIVVRSDLCANMFKDIHAVLIVSGLGLSVRWQRFAYLSPQPVAEECSPGSAWLLASPCPPVLARRHTAPGADLSWSIGRELCRSFEPPGGSVRLFRPVACDDYTTEQKTDHAARSIALMMFSSSAYNFGSSGAGW